MATHSSDDYSSRSAVKSGVTLWNNAAAARPIVEGGELVGLEIKRENQVDRVRARKGVVLASGGFSRSAHLTRQYLSTHDYTASPRGNRGDGKRIGQQLGGALPQTPVRDRALYSLISEFHPRQGPTRAYPHLMDIAKPGAIIVDGDGKRFANESTPYRDLGRATVDAGVKKVYLIADRRHLQRYGMGLSLPAPYPTSGTMARGYRGHVKSAASIPALAEQLKMQPETLCATVNRFNEFALSGKDHDFSRGEGSYDQMIGDSRSGPNPCLAPLQTGPFYALPMHLGTSVTMYGLQTNTDGQVLDAKGKVIRGLYAVGADSNHFLNGKYPSGGMTLGPSMVFGYRTGLRLAAT